MARISLPPTTSTAGTGSGKAEAHVRGVLAADFTSTSTGAYIDIGLSGTIPAGTVTADGICTVNTYLEVSNSTNQNILVGLGISSGGTPTGPAFYCWETPGAVDNAVAFSAHASNTVTSGNAIVIRTFVYQSSAGTITVKGAADRAILTAQYFAT